MKIHFVTEGDLQSEAEGAARWNCDVAVFGFHGLGEVDYRRELSGETSKLEDMAILSRELKCVIISGCNTDSCGLRHKSAVLADRGKILGVTDMINATDAEVKGGAHLKVYETSAGKIGLVVGEDLFYPNIAQALALFDADVLFCIFGEIADAAPQFMLRADAFCAGLPICMSAEGIAQIASAEGEIVLRTARREWDYSLNFTREYRLVTVRTRGMRRKDAADF